MSLGPRMFEVYKTPLVISKWKFNCIIREKGTVLLQTILLLFNSEMYFPLKISESHEVLIQKINLR